MKQRGRWRLLLPLGGIALFLCRPEAARAGAREGLTLCAAVLIPSLYPVSVLSGCLLRMADGRGTERLAGRWMRALFGLPAAAALPLALGLLGGFPLGARLAAEACRAGALTREEAARLSGLCNNAGPAFLLGAAGTMLGSPVLGGALLGIQLLSALLTGLLLRRPGEAAAGEVPAAQGQSLWACLPVCIGQSAEAMLRLTGAVVFFRAFTACLGSLLSPERLPRLWQAALTGLLEVSAGIRQLAWLPPALALPAAAGLICWGGLCVHLQAAEALSAAAVPVKPYLRAKALQGGLGLLLSLAVSILFFS